MTLRNPTVILVVLSAALSPAFGQEWASNQLDTGSTGIEGFDPGFPG